MGNLLGEIYRRVPLDEKTAILYMFKYRTGSGADFEVKAVKPYTKTDNKKKVTYGSAHIILDGKKNAKINVIDVKSACKDTDIKTKILKFIIAFLTDGNTEEIVRVITGEKSSEELDFYTKNGFNVKNEYMSNGYQHTDVSIILNKPPFGQFSELYEAPQYIDEKEYRLF